MCIALGAAIWVSLRAALATIALVLAVSGVSALTLETVKARGALLCGVNEGLPGFSYMDERGAWSGFDVDFCRAIAAAIFADPNRLKLVPLSAEARFRALRDGKIDVLSRNSTWTMGREVAYGLEFVGVTYYDGQGFMTPRAMRVSSANELDGARVCALTGTTTIDNLADFFSANHMALETVAVGSTDELIKAYESGRCNVVTSDLSQLYALRQRLANPRAHVILPDVISKEPLGPVVRQTIRTGSRSCAGSISPCSTPRNSASASERSARPCGRRSPRSCASWAHRAASARTWASATPGP